MGESQLILKDIHLPGVMGWWPPAIGWWILLVIIPLFIGFIIWLYRRITRKTAVKSAKKWLTLIEQDDTLDDQQKLIQLSELVRRAAISCSSRNEVASLTGQAWLSYLDSSVTGKPFTQGVGVVFADGHYRKQPYSNLEIAPLIALCKSWLSAQKS